DDRRPKSFVGSSSDLNLSFGDPLYLHLNDTSANTLRRFSRQTKLPSSLNDFIVEGKVKYGVERVANYANLNHDNYCFVSALNKSVEPTCYEETILDSNWINAMNSKIEALNENYTWIIIDLPPGRKAIGNKKYCLELLKEYGLLGCKPVSTPMEPNSVLPYVPTKNDPLLDNITGYQKLLGKLIYLTHTRPDIAYSIHCLAQYMHSLLKSHMNSTLNVLRYLKGAPGKGIRYKYFDCKNNLTCYSDAD
nr:ribonuclease H-like domain-containing protein [Tanacetum cinerariifolium]